MARFIKSRNISKGQMPGSLIFIGNQKMEESEISLIQYNEEEMLDEKQASIQDGWGKIIDKKVNWINVNGLHNPEIIRQIGEKFDLHGLLLEDIMNTDMIPKYVSGKEYDAIILKMLRYDESNNNISSEQISFILGEHYLITLQEQIGDVFEPVRERIKTGKGRIRKRGNDYLTYALMDVIADHYLLLIEKIGRQIEDLEKLIFHGSDAGAVEMIYKYKLELNFLRKSVRPLKEIIFNLSKNEDTYFSESTLVFLSNLNDQINQTIDSIELYSSILSDQLSMYHTNMSNKMNQVMKTLTIFSSIFIPLTFLAGIYGMNFEYMPELKFRYGYFIFWTISVSLVIVLFMYFKRKKWF